MMKPLLLLALLAWSAPLSAQDAQATQSAELPPIVDEGFRALLDQGPAAGVEVWTAGWQAETDIQQREQLKSAFEQIWATVGAAEGYEVVVARPIGSRLIDVYGVTFHPQQPLYVYLALYEGAQGWIVASINAHTSRGEVYPEWVTGPGAS